MVSCIHNFRLNAERGSGVLAGDRHVLDIESNAAQRMEMVTMLVMETMVVDRVAVQIWSHCLQMSRN